MSEEIKLGRLARDAHAAQIEIRRAEGKRVALSFSASSEAPVERSFGTEVLSHTAAAVRMDRLEGGAVPLLFNHDWSDPVGMITGARLRSKRLEVDAELFATSRAAEVAAMVEGGLRNVSIGYELEEVTEDARNRGTWVATRWSPLEISIVTVPADPSVGIGRSDDNHMKAVRMVRAAAEPAAVAALPGVPTMAENQAAAGQPAAEVQTRAAQVHVIEDNSRPDPVEFEKRRKAAISNLCRANKLDERYAQHWIGTGAALETVSEELVKVLGERTSDQAATFLDMPKAEVRRYSLMRALRAAQNKDWSKAGLELEANKEVSKRLNKLPRAETSFFVPLDKLLEGRGRQRGYTRDMDVAGTSGSQYLVTTQNEPGNFIELMRNTSVTLRMGVRRLSGLVGNVTIPKMTAGNTAYWLSDETTQITESQPTIGQLSLSPKNVAAMTELSHQLMQQSTPDVEQLVLDSIARDIALAVDVGVLRGSGGSGQPTGIVATGGIGAFTGTSLAAAGVLNAQADVAAANALNPGCGYVTTPAVAALLMDRPELTTTGTTPLWTGNMLQGQLKGFSCMSSNQMATATMLFGWWDSVILAEWGVLELMTNPFSDFTRGLTAVRGWYTCDVGMRYPAAFSYSSSIT